MTDAIIGGAIAAVIGAVGYAIVGLWLEYRREKAQRLTIVEALLTETVENLTICTHPMAREMWWFAPYKLEAYHAHKSKLFFLPEDVRIRLADAVFIMDGCNIGIQVHQLRVAYGQSIEEKPVPPYAPLIEHLEFVDKELRKWRKEHSR